MVYLGFSHPKTPFSLKVTKLPILGEGIGHDREKGFFLDIYQVSKGGERRVTVAQNTDVPQGWRGKPSPQQYRSSSPPSSRT
ncbi:hypothetical protein E2C01_029384 [Portunus trituberculatus]|uniref:Uncharacterized protein n=1 Tax=Portunus trituberculatus TaxID=210409 RepID=A0A5B7ERB7_PORTR|nr:hypothetical protein [Portunus trituberculatus]